MSRTTVFPVHTLTEDQAVEELAEIFDSAPLEEDQLARIHWSQEHSARAQQLEQHIAHLQRRAGGPGGSFSPPSGEPQVAPPPHLQPEAAVAPLPVSTKEIPVSAKKTPKEKLDHLVATYETALEAAKKAPADREARNKVSDLKSQMKNLCASFRLSFPLLERLPALPDPKPKGGARPGVKPAPAVPKPRPVDQVLDAHIQATEKAGPGPYVEPTAEDLRESLGGWVPIPEPMLAGSRPAMNLGPSRRRTAQEIARGIRKDFWDLLAAIEDLEGRQALRTDLSLIGHLSSLALELVDEGARAISGANMDAIKDSLRKTTRDNFSPGFVLVAMKDDRIEPEDYRRLLEEACHALSRDRQKLHRLEEIIESAHRYIVQTAE